jgi:hypothetical protein
MKNLNQPCVSINNKNKDIFSPHINARAAELAHSLIHLLHECKQSRNTSGLSCSLHCRCLGQASVRVDSPVPSQSHADHAPVIHCRHVLCRSRKMPLVNISRAIKLNFEFTTLHGSLSAGFGAGQCLADTRCPLGNK